MTARANAVLPTPRSPESVTRSPGLRTEATSDARRRVACSLGSAIEKLEAGETASIFRASLVAHDLVRKPVPNFRDHALLFCRRLLRRPSEREDAGDGGSAAHGRIELHRTTMQLDEGTHDREPKAGAPMRRAERMTLEPADDA